tara:strand:+ start:1034 stop:1315 length:282 start_codon:yes stop_codon:yes gene_type:complete
MANLHKAIRAIHSGAVTINGNDKTDIVALDDSGNQITINWTNVEAWTDPDEYKIKRAAEYPPMGDQLDDLYKAGAFSSDMAAKIKAVKDKYPK